MPGWGYPWGDAHWFPQEGTFFFFSAPAFAVAEPSDGLVDVVAHELCHCYRQAEGIWTAIVEEEEAATRELARALGFQPDPFWFGAFATEIAKWQARNYDQFGSLTQQQMLAKLVQHPR